MNPNPEIIEKVLSLLRQWGWETGYEKLEAELQVRQAAGGKEARDCFLGWMAAERGKYGEAIQHFEAMAKVLDLAGWAMLGLAFVAMRETDFDRSKQFLAEAAQHATTDNVLQAAISHLKGTVLFHQGDAEQASSFLNEAWQFYGKDHFATGRVLDSLGMLYAGKDNFHAAREFFNQALQCKTRHGDQAGLALTHGQLGRLYLDWGLWESAEKHFQEDLRISVRIGDERGEAQMFNFLGQLELAYGERAAAAGQMAQAGRRWEKAAGWLDSSIRLSQNKIPALEAYARKDRALVFLAEGDTAGAEQQVRKAEEIFQEKFKEGNAHAKRVWGILQRKLGRFDDSMTSLRDAMRHFVDSREPIEIARTQFEIARTHNDSGDPRPLVSQSLLEALKTAEACRRAELVRQIEAELALVDPEAHCAHVYQRVRGLAVREDTVSLMDGRRETVTVLYLDLKGSTDFARGRDPAEVLLTLNQMMSDLVNVLRRHDARVSGFRGDGFLAILRDADHAVRSVNAALELFAAMKEFNKPRDVLNLPRFVARIGIATGEVVMGNVGTYDKMDFTAIGTTANLGARLEANAEPGLPCISQETYNVVRDRFQYKEGNPRTVDLKGLGSHPIWDVIGRRDVS